MTVNEILTLLSAGYTKEEIDKLTSDQITTDTPFPSPVNAETPVTGEKSPVMDGEPEPEVKADEDKPAAVGITADQLESMISRLLAGIQENARADAEMKARIIDPHESAIDTLRSISDIPTNS